MKRINRIIAILFGDSRLDPLSRRMFNAVTGVNGVINLFGVFGSFFLPNFVELFVLHFVTGILFLTYYYFSRFRNLHRPFFWPFNLTILIFLSVNWFLNGGSVGGAHYYFIVALVIATILLDGRRPYAIYAVSLLFVGSLFLMEHLHPEWVVPYPNPMDRFLDVGPNFLFVQILTGILIFVLNKNLDIERQKADRLLLNILPESVAEELKLRDRVTPKGYASVTVLFADMVGFTSAAAGMTPEALIEELDHLFAKFDASVRALGLEKIKTIGDAYMAAGGLPATNLTHPVDAVLCGLRFLKIMEKHSHAREETGKPGWDLRVGLHCGPVVAGVVGTDKFVYDIWGDTVNTASRMESACAPGKVNISRDLYNVVHPFFDCEERGSVAVKGKGELDMYFVRGIRPELQEPGHPTRPGPKFMELYYRLRVDSTDMLQGLQGPPEEKVV